jgi:hypothetical protein
VITVMSEIPTHSIYSGRCSIASIYTVCTMHSYEFYFLWRLIFSNLQTAHTVVRNSALMSLRVCSPTLTLLRHCSVRSSPASLHRSLRRAYATQAQPHSHHLPTKPSIFGQPTSKSHTQLGERVARTSQLPTFIITEKWFLCAHAVKQGEVTPGIPASEYERRRRQLVDSLPDGSLVVCMTGNVKYMSGGKHAHQPWAIWRIGSHTAANP